MKGLVKTSLATALALATGQAMALGLGPIQVRSGLNQPLVAEIPVLADTPAEANELRVDLASAEDFQRVGLNRGRVGVPLEFSVSSNGKGQSVIRVTTKEIVREPFLDFLIEVNWSKGKLLREYTVLLDPPVTAPAVVTSSKPVARPVAPASAERPSAPLPAPAETRPVVSSPAPAPAPAHAASPAAAPHVGAVGEYGPVQKGQALSTIARTFDVTTPANLNQVMLALLKANPGAFYRDNVNALKSGAVLRIPTSEEVAAVGSLKDAAVAVQAQNQSWADIAKPTQVNDVGAPTSVAAVEAPAKPSAPAKPEHLSLVPPQSGKGDSGSASGGSGSGGAKDAETRAELARTKETLATKEQESAELKSRVKQLEDINDKGQHLISLKDSEIAELQNKLKELQAKSAAAPAKPVETPPAPKTVEVPPPAPPKIEASTPAPAPAPASDSASKAAEVAAASKLASDATKTETPPPPAAAPAPASSAPASPGVTVTPLPDTSSNTSSTAAAPAAAPAPAAAKPAPKPAVKPAAPQAEKSWWSDYLGDSPYPLYGIGAVLVLLGLWAASKLFGKPKSSVRPGYRDLTEETEPSPDTVPPANEQQLLDHLAEHPDDTDASMELLRHYYVQGDATQFEAVAEGLQHKLAEDSSQWAEVVAMGEDLAPHHHLFARAHEAAHEHEAHEHEDAHAFDTSHSFEAAAPATSAPYETMVDKPRAELETQHFDFEDLHAHADHAEPPAAAHESAPTHAREAEMTRVHEAVHTAPTVHHARDEDEADHEAAATEFFTGEDTISTRLDLARAYLDMGDPEGARSMLDEVLAEGNATQKEEARKLLAEIR